MALSTRQIELAIRAVNFYMDTLMEELDEIEQAGLQGGTAEAQQVRTLLREHSGLVEALNTLEAAVSIG